MNNLLILIKLLPVLIQLIKAIEEALPGQGAGEQKLALLRTLLEIADSKILDNWGMISTVVGSLVKTFNSTGWGK